MPHCGIMNRLAAAIAARYNRDTFVRLSHDSWGTSTWNPTISLGGHSSRTQPRPPPSPWPLPRPRTPKPTASTSPNERLRIGFIGVGGRAQTHLDSAIKLQNEGKVEIAAVCDVFNRHREEAADKIKRGTKHKPKQIADYRDILNDPSIDAVVHRHARPLARQANDRRAQGRQARLLRKADDAQRRRGDRRLQSLEGVGPGDAGRRAIDVAARVEGRQRTPLRRPARQSADVSDVVLPQLRRRPVALLRARPPT